MKNIYYILIYAIFLTILLLGSAKQIYAISFDDIITGAKKFIAGGEKRELSIESTITLSPDGDVNKNSEIDAGDIVRFTYTLKNTTDKKYSFGTLKTNIDRKQLNFFHNVQGTSNLVDNNITIDIANLQINPAEIQIISFDARTLYSNDDNFVSTEAEFLDADNKSIIKALKQTESIMKNLPEIIPGVKIEKK